MPFGDPSLDTFLPTLVVNPGLEEVTLTATSSGRYRAATVDFYRPLGLKPPSSELARSTSDVVTAWLTDDRLIVRCGQLYWIAPLDANHRAIANEIRRHNGVVLGVSTAVDPCQLENPEPLKRIRDSGDIALIFTALCTREPPPNLTGHTVMVNSEFTHADESRDMDWLPEMVEYRGPTYDLHTGRFELGTGMDGPIYWRLHTPGVGVENGLIAGPADTGKTNILSILILEALYSTVFHYGLVDPLNRNRLAELFGERAVGVATTRTEASDLLAAFVRAVDARTPHGERYRDPSPEYPGMLLAVDDAHEVLRDPDAASLATHIAINGPKVGVGIVVSTMSVDVEDFAGRHDLLRALTQRNIMVFNQEQLDEVLRLRGRD
ncbi:MAG: hypothetical protein JO115_24730 [Pseudonocardiales bacterium]|nr:hypothetical protein [Pseudonocardiales bacterium]